MNRENEELLEFPCDFIFKAMGINDDAQNFTAAVHKAVSEVTPVSRDSMKEKLSSKGHYVSVSVVVRVVDWPQVHAIYARLREVEGLKYLL